MSRALGVDRNICQRIVAATAKGEADVGMLIQLPGIAGMRQFLRALQERPGLSRVQRESLASTGAAIDLYETLLTQLAGSQRKLRERLDASLDSSPESCVVSGDLASRRQLFRAAARITGRWSQSWVCMRMIRPIPGDPLMTESIVARGHIGHRWREGALPLEIGEHVQPRLASASDDPAYRSLSNSEDARRFLFGAFCSQPLPQIISRALGNKMVHVIEGSTPADVPVDIVIADRRAQPDRHPATQDPPFGEVWSMITFPAQHLVFDVYLHREIASRCTPSLEQHLWGPHSGSQGLWRWSTRFPGGPRLQDLGFGLQNAPTDAYPRHAELTRAMFAQAGWDPSEFVGYRCSVEYPVWRSGYCMLFDFTGFELGSGTPADRS